MSKYRRIAGLTPIALAVVILAVQANSQYLEWKWFDQYSKVTSWEEKLHLDNFAIYLLKDPSLLGYMAFRVGENEKASVVRKRAERNKQYLVRKRGVPSDRIRLIYLGKADKTTFILQPLTRDKPFPGVGNTP